MGLKITFINPNTEQDMDKYLPKILAEAVMNKISKEVVDDNSGGDHEVKYSA